MLLSTTREALLTKLSLFSDYCIMNCLKINWDKSCFLVINGDQTDRIPCALNDKILINVPSFVYLGNSIHSSGFMRDNLSMHISSKKKDVDKFKTFLFSNHNMPFVLKKRVFNACVQNALLYGCECWVGDISNHLDKLYSTLLQCLLGVRQCIPLNLLLAESGIPAPSFTVFLRQWKFFNKNSIITDMTNRECPIGYAFHLCSTVYTNMYNFICYIQSIPYPSYVGHRQDLLTKLSSPQSSRAQDYLLINPSFDTHEVYSSFMSSDQLRINFTRIRLSSYNLEVERGRWRGIPREERLCSACHVVEDIAHFLLHCNRFQGIRASFEHNVNFDSLRSFFASSSLSILNFINKICLIHKK